MTTALTDAAIPVRRPVQILGLLTIFLTAACDVNPYDPAQKPTVTVTQVNTAPFVLIAWQPSGAQFVRVYRGTVAGNGYGERLMWSLAESSSNSLTSGMPYGAEPGNGTTDVAAKPLVPGERYTVEVTRRDPKGSGDGFTNTNNRYVGVATFTYIVP